MADTQINLVVIRATDIEISFEFYAKLGLSFTKHRHGKGPEHYASETSGATLEIYPSQTGPINANGLRLGFQVSSVDETLAALVPMNTPIVSPAKDSPWGRRAVVDDPDGYRVELIEAIAIDDKETEWDTR